MQRVLRRGSKKETVIEEKDQEMIFRRQCSKWFLKEEQIKKMRKL